MLAKQCFSLASSQPLLLCKLLFAEQIVEPKLDDGETRWQSSSFSSAGSPPLAVPANNLNKLLLGCQGGATVLQLTEA